MTEIDVSEVYDLGMNQLLCTCGNEMFKHMAIDNEGRECTYVCTECNKGYLNPSDLLFANEGRLYRGDKK